MGHKLTIEIYGTKYPITTTEDPDYVAQLSREIDRTLSDLMRMGNLSLNQALLLLSLQYLDSHKKAEQGSDHLRSQVAEYLEDAGAARAELAAALQRLEKLEKQGQEKQGGK
jgi:cell division protein ZapA (FtsZ GTPase activity inhibitor)